jgi:hypothetical protein
VRSYKTLKTYIHIKFFLMEVAVDSSVPQGFDMDEGAAAPIYRPNDIPAEPEQDNQEQENDQVQPIYYEIPMPKQEEKPEIIYHQPPPQETTIFSSISPVIWMVIIFVAFILGFFMGMGSSSRGNYSPGQAAPIILTSGRGV